MSEKDITFVSGKSHIKTKTLRRKKINYSKIKKEFNLGKYKQNILKEIQEDLIK